ncbi:MAG: GNAT family N-acetyltransferase [Weeksellaceae bacterium]|nr:GNAT family N-acetyltransferase [Weeksellaceae bacterium]
MINIVGLNKLQLKGFTACEHFQKLAFAPISAFREISQTHNPRANDDDVLLFLAYNADQLAGYFGILPDELTLPDGEKIHFGWLSTLFVSEDFRGLKIAPQLLLAAEKAYSQNLMVTEFTPSAERLYRKSAMFEDFAIKNGVRYYFQSNLAQILPSKREIFAKNKKILKHTDNLVNTFIPYFSPGKNHLYKISKSIDKNLDHFIAKEKKNPIGRSSEEFRWMLDFPWLSTEKEQPDYLFSSYSKDYDMFWVSVYQHQEIVSAMLCSARDGHLKVLYYFGNIGLNVEILPKIIKKYKIKMMTIFDGQINSAIQKNKIPKALYKRPMRRKYMIHSGFREKLGENFDFKFMDGDGDFSFT